jgi:hypothetical protein
MACQMTSITPYVKCSVPQGSLPVTCVLDNPPTGVTIASVILADPTGTPTNLATDGMSFQIPSVAKKEYNLAVKLVGPLTAAARVVEGCDNKTPIIKVTDLVYKAADCTLEVV